MRCPDPEVLAELGAGGLPDAERGALLDHAASCAECRAVVAVVAESTVTSQPGTASLPAEMGRIDRYELRRIVGRGAMSVVYAAHDPVLDREIALKLLRPSASAARLHREAQALAKLAHPNVVRVFDVGEHGAQTFIAMELVEGENLREWLRTPRALDEIMAVLVKAGHGLAAAHAAGLVHRDFKPDNVLIAKNGGVLVGDFGLARRVESPSEDVASIAVAMALSSDSLTASGMVVGTPAYMAPEQAAGEATAASDQYAFSITAWEACFGRRPFDGATWGELRDQARSGEPRKSDDRAVPKRIEDALRRGMAFDANARFAGMDALLRALVPPARRRWPLIAVATTSAAIATTIAVVVAGSSASHAASCEEMGARIAPAWGPDVEMRMKARWGSGVASGFARYAASWQQRRIDACRATHERREQTVTTLEQRVACFDRARTSLQLTVEALLSTHEALPRPDVVIESLPSLDRCDGSAPAQGTPPPEHAAAIAALDIDLAKLDVSLQAGAPSVSAAATVALRQRAEQLGYQPQVLRALLLEARVATWVGDVVAAEAVLRRVMLLAEEAADDFTRTHAGALLAKLLAEPRLAEATALAAAARATLARAGGDPALEQALLEAEVAIATSRGAHREAAALQERVIAVARTRFGDDSAILSHAYARLNVLWASVGDMEQATAALRQATEIAIRAPDAPSPDVAEILRMSIVERVGTGDYEGGAALGRRQLVMMRALPVHSLKAEALTVGQVAFAHEMDGDFRSALATYREAEQLWRRPPAEFTASGEELDPVAMAYGVAESVFAQGTCLFGLGRVEAAIVELERARALALAGGTATAALVEPTARWLGQAFVAVGRYRDARELLEPMADTLFTDPRIKPFPRATAAFALAQALWADGGLRDRPRALALAADAERELKAAIADGEAHAYLRKLPARARAELARVAAWRAAR